MYLALSGQNATAALRTFGERTATGTNAGPERASDSQPTWPPRRTPWVRWQIERLSLLTHGGLDSSAQLVRLCGDAMMTRRQQIDRRRTWWPDTTAKVPLRHARTSAMTGVRAAIESPPRLLHLDRTDRRQDKRPARLHFAARNISYVSIETTGSVEGGFLMDQPRDSPPPEETADTEQPTG